MFECDNKSCKLWLHAECLEKDACKKAYERLVGGGTITADAKTATTNASDDTPGKKGRKRKTAHDEAPWEGLFSAKVTVNDEPPQIEITDHREETQSGQNVWKEDIICPSCHAKVV